MKKEQNILYALVISLFGCPSTEYEVELPTEDDQSENIHQSDSHQLDTGGDQAGIGSDIGHDAADAAVADQPQDQTRDLVDDAFAGLDEVFVFQGHVGRVAFSCDGGQTIQEARNDDQSFSCIGVDCDHRPGSGVDITYDGDGFIFSFGWGAPGRILRTTNFTEWTVLFDGQSYFAGTAFGNDTLVASDYSPVRSLDNGQTWLEPVMSMQDQWTSRGIWFVPHEDGVFLQFSGGDQNDIVRSLDNGESFSPSTSQPANCVSWVQGVAYGNGVIVASGRNGDVCRSDDGGDTWVHTDLGESQWNVRKPIFTGNRFEIYDIGQRWISTDGVEWVSETITSLNFADIARSKDGVYIAVNGDWQRWYDEQKFFRSVDGVNFEELPASQFEGGHPIRNIEVAYVKPGQVCP